MSFNELKKSDYTKKSKELSFDIDGKTLAFTANEISHFEKMDVLASLSNNQEWVTKLVVYSIRDQKGVKMNREQASTLPSEYAEAFLNAAIEVNPLDGSDKEAKKN